MKELLLIKCSPSHIPHDMCEKSESSDFARKIITIIFLSDIQNSIWHIDLAHTIKTSR